MAKQIKFTYKNDEYTLEFSREIIKEMEDEGFSLNEMNVKPITMVSLLYSGAFKMHHSGLTQEKIDEIITNLDNKEGLLEELANMVNDSVSFLMEDPKDTKNAITWEVA